MFFLPDVTFCAFLANRKPQNAGVANFFLMTMNSEFRSATDVSISRYTPEGVIYDVIGQLALYFEELMPEGDFESFLNEHMDLFATDEQVNEISVVRDFLRENSTEQDAARIAHRRALASIKISIFFCQASNKAYSEGSMDRSWHFASQASKWLGLTIGSEHIFRMQKEERSTFSKLGGLSRAKTYDPIRKFAVELARNGNFASRRNAALSIKPQVLAYAKERGIYLSEQQAEITIGKWLKCMTFASKRHLIAGGRAT